jgi:hypothetical protein
MRAACHARSAGERGEKKVGAMDSDASGDKVCSVVKYRHVMLLLETDLKFSDMIDSKYLVRLCFEMDLEICDG